VIPLNLVFTPSNLRGRTLFEDPARFFPGPSKLISHSTPMDRKIIFRAVSQQTRDIFLRFYTPLVNVLAPACSKGGLIPHFNELSEIPSQPEQYWTSPQQYPVTGERGYSLRRQVLIPSS